MIGKNNIKNNIKYTNTPCKGSAMKFLNFLVFVEGSDPCVLTSHSVLYTNSREIINLC